ncbi:binding-protein-dependent transport systems inner membrane component [Beutenbergia cavernae DSM 12333]|uniref:Binding-protein-dependent transport systems inner membrane component n=1 Tax=Beutenbergia cavernae (strain ATCC BAA-8 / DSM 12333 / CCUG 43141 / JCM 11478 / NBRC 16432 / NCIMB 13614 / HKI 0122) TaxID=471853 RepID=C5BYX8_BEUC1|nr:carbohydrate ABC transporter permease [Beutenbergia cavernae]ACQ81093.1 binding-protein-dependent transport systems inner membrane component [Beutenbergia cavernae DSM 12333]
MTTATSPFARGLETVGAWLLGLLWLFPLVYALWASVHHRDAATRLDLTAPLTFDNFVTVWNGAPFDRYYLNTILLVCGILAGQLVLGTLAAYAFARFDFAGKNIAFALVLVQLMITPDILISENYSTMARLELVDTIPAIGLPYIASAFGIFLLRQTFKSMPIELDEAAEIEGCSRLGRLWRVYVPLAKPTLVAYGLVSVSTHWNNFLWPLVITNSVEARPLTVGLSIYNGTESGIDWTLMSAATVIVVAPLLVAFLLFQRQFVQSFMRAGIR